MKKSKTYLYILLFSAVYFISYLTRTNYAAVMLDMIAKDGISQVTASLALTVSALTYAAGQLVSGYLGDKFKPERLILCGLAGATLMNLFIAVLPWVWLRSVLWGINGFAQAMIWPPLVRIMAGLFDSATYKKATLYVSLAASVATIAVYLISPLIISFSSWRGVFIFSTSAGIIMCVVWSILSKGSFNAVKDAPKQESAHDHGGVKVHSAIFVLVIVGFVIILQGILRDGLTTWTPVLVAQSFDLNSESAILTGVIMPLFSMFSLSLASFVSRKLIKNEFLCAGFFFAVGAIGLTLMSFSSNIALSLIGGAVAQGVMHGVNYCFTCLVPAYFYKLNKTSLVAGLINCGAYIGSSISGVGTAFLTERLSWSSVVLVWAAVAALGVIITAVFAFTWKRFKAENQIK